jgi:hypothetical protein
MRTKVLVTESNETSAHTSEVALEQGGAFQIEHEHEDDWFSLVLELLTNRLLAMGYRLLSL